MVAHARACMRMHSHAPVSSHIVCRHSCSALMLGELIGAILEVILRWRFLNTSEASHLQLAQLHPLLSRPLASHATAPTVASALGSEPTRAFRRSQTDPSLSFHARTKVSFDASTTAQRRGQTRELMREQARGESARELHFEYQKRGGSISELQREQGASTAVAQSCGSSEAVGIDTGDGSGVGSGVGGGEGSGAGSGATKAKNIHFEPADREKVADIPTLPPLPSPPPLPPQPPAATTIANATAPSLASQGHAQSPHHAKHLVNHVLQSCPEHL